MSRAGRHRLWLVSVACAGVLMLSACATGTGAATASPEPTVTAATVSPSPTPTQTEDVPTSTPVPTETPDVEAPYNGDVLIVTSEMIGSQFQVTAMLPGVSEAEGTCTLEMLDQPISTSVTGTAGNDVTYCGVMAVTPSAQDSAEVRFRVTYASASTRAASADSTIELPR